jgi:hypothetical protein
MLSLLFDVDQAKRVVLAGSQRALRAVGSSIPLGGIGVRQRQRLSRVSHGDFSASCGRSVYGFSPCALLDDDDCNQETLLGKPT